MNSLPSAKYKQTLNEIEKESLNSEASRERFNFLRLQKLEKKKLFQKKFNKKIYEKKKLKLRSPLEVGEVLVLTSQLKKKKTHQENFTRAVLITSLTFTSQRYFS